MNALVLSNGQQAAYDAFVAFITHPTEEVFLLEGYAGTGKSTLVDHILNTLSSTLKTVKLITQTKDDWEVVLTATTNKACEALREITGQEVRTIHSLLSLRVETDYKAKTTTLVPAGGVREELENKIIFIDEASFIDEDLLLYIMQDTKNCKIIFIGDRAQLAPIMSTRTPAFHSGFKGAALTEVLRQAKGNPIIDLATGFRNTVNGAPWPKFVFDGKHLLHIPRAEFEKRIITECSRDDWHHNDTKVLAYTNKAVIAYNHGVRNIIQGIPELEVGDYAICNSYIGNKRCKVSTDATVMITDISPASEHGVSGWNVVMDKVNRAFLPAFLEDKRQRLIEARKNDEWELVQHIDTTWIDLRAAYACTVNKSQGSTYNKVFIDLDNLRRCYNPNNLARLMYVSVSRARHQVIFTGDLVKPKR
jgi:hypothetical protein